MRRNARLARAAAAAATAADRPGGEAEDGFEDGFEDDYDDDLWRLPAAEWGGRRLPAATGAQALGLGPVGQAERGGAPARRYRDSP